MVNDAPIEREVVLRLNRLEAVELLLLLDQVASDLRTYAQYTRVKLAAHNLETRALCADRLFDLLNERMST